MIRPIAFCAGFGFAALVWGTADAADFECGAGFWTDTKTACDALKQATQSRIPLNSWAISKPDDAVKIEIDDLKDRVEWLERIINSMLPECSGEPPEHLPCIERETK